MSSPKSDPRLIFLIGFPGSGKSTLGRALAARMPGVPFIDLDEATERILGMTAAEAFSALGPDAFRRAESEALRRLCAGATGIVACGGGTPCFGNNMDMMLAAGTVVRLTASRQRLLRRLEEADGQRPLLAGLHGEALEAKVNEMMCEREPFYARAHLTFDATYLETEAEVARTCRRFLSACPFPSHNP